MPNRILRDGLLTSDSFNSLEPFQQMFFVRLLLVVDDYGCFDARPSVLKSALYPVSENVKKEQVQNWLESVALSGLIRLYKVNGKPYVEVLNFRQRIRAYKRKYPHDGHMSDTCQTDDGHMSDTCQTDDGHMSDTCQTDDGHMSDTCQTDDGHMSDTCQTDDGHMSDTCQTDDGHMSDTCPHKTNANTNTNANTEVYTSDKVKTKAIPCDVTLVIAYMKKLPLISLPDDELERCANAFFDINEERGWVTRDNIPMRNWQGGAKRFVEGWQRKYAERIRAGDAGKNWNVKGNVDKNRTQYLGL